MAIIYFTDALSGNDNAGGSSEGFPKASGIDAVVTSGNQTIDLSGDSPNLSTAVSGDTIRINGSTDGIRSTDIFEISAVDDGTDTVTVVQTPGSSVSGLTWAVGGAFQTIQRPVLCVVAGDYLWMKASASYEENVTQLAVGSEPNPISFQGYLSVSGDGGSIVLDGTSNPGIGWRANEYCFYKNIRVTGFSSNGVQGNNNLNFSDWVNCEFDNNGNNGIALRSSNTLIECYFHDNGARGCTIGNEYNTFAGCVFADNTTEGIYLGGKFTTLMNCLITGNSGHGIWAAVADQSAIINCTIDGSGQTTQIGVNYSGDFMGRCIFYNNIVVGCVSGVTSAIDYKEMPFSVNNLLFDNTFDYSNFRTERGEVLADPLFVGSGDYSLQSGSPALDAGFDISSNPWLTTTAEAISIGAY